MVEQPDRILEMSASDIAVAAQASEGLVIGLCQQIGARGFAELKIAVAKEIATSRALLHEAIVPGDSTAHVVAKFTASHAVALEDTAKVLDTAEIDRAAECMVAAKRIEFYGIGTSAPIAEDAAYRFLRLPTSSFRRICGFATGRVDKRPCGPVQLSMARAVFCQCLPCARGNTHLRRILDPPVSRPRRKDCCYGRNHARCYEAI